MVKIAILESSSNPDSSNPACNKCFTQLCVTGQPCNVVWVCTVTISEMMDDKVVTQHHLYILIWF